MRFSGSHGDAVLDINIRLSWHYDADSERCWSSRRMPSYALEVQRAAVGKLKPEDSPGTSTRLRQASTLVLGSV